MTDDSSQRKMTDRLMRRAHIHEGMCPKCEAWHGRPPLAHLSPEDDCGHNPEAPCLFCGFPVGAISMGGSRVCSWCDCGEPRPEIIEKLGYDAAKMFMRRPDRVDLFNKLLLTDAPLLSVTMSSKMSVLEEMEAAINCAVDTGDPCNICDDARRHLAAVRELVEAASAVYDNDDAFTEHGGVGSQSVVERDERLAAALAPFLATTTPAERDDDVR